MPRWLHLRHGQTTMFVLALTAMAGVTFATGGVFVLQVVQGANQLTFLQVMALGTVLGGMPTAVTLWVIKLLYGVRSELSIVQSVLATKCSVEDVRTAILSAATNGGD